MTRRSKLNRPPTATELRLSAIREGDKSFAIMLAPVVTAFANLIVIAWVLGMIVALGRGAGEGVLLLAIGLVPVVLLLLLERMLRRMADGYRRERESKVQ